MTTSKKKKRIRNKNPVKPPKLKEMEAIATKDVFEEEDSSPTETPKVRWANVYPSPKKTNKKYTEYWNLYIEDVAERENFKRGHLLQLSVLCDLYVDLQKMDDFLDENGLTYESTSKNGFQIKPRPELIQKNRILSEIRNYSKMLGLLLVKDTNFVDPEEGEENWS